MMGEIKLLNWTLPHPIIVASGPLGSNPKSIRAALAYGASAVVTKTICDDNRYAKGIMHISHELLFNMEGYSQRSLMEWEKYLDSLRGLPVIASVYSEDPDTMVKLANMAVDCGIEMLELGVSCPTINKDPLCFNLKELYNVCRKVRDAVSVPVVAKLLVSMSSSMNINMVKCVMKSGLDGVTISDTLPAVFPIGNVYKIGGLSGRFLKPVVLRALYDIRSLNTCKIASGGIFTGHDIIDYLNCGATAVEVCTSILNKSRRQLGILVEEYRKLCHTHIHSK